MLKIHVHFLDADSRAGTCEIHEFQVLPGIGETAVFMCDGKPEAWKVFDVVYFPESEEAIAIYCHKLELADHLNHLKHFRNL